MTNILMAVYLNNLVRILWKEVMKEERRLDEGGMPVANYLQVAIILRAILWPVVLLGTIVSIFIQGTKKYNKGA